MRRWERVAFRCTCGGCGAALGEGMAVLTISFPNMKRALKRCEECAGPAPVDLPAHHVKNPLCPCSTCQGAKKSSTKPMQPLAKTAREWMPYQERE